MDKKLIDFNDEFSKYIKNWLTENSNSSESLDDVELRMPEIYETWLNTPKEFLSGKKPKEYFLDFETNDLINLLVKYGFKHIRVPDPLLDAIISKKKEALPLLADISLGKFECPDGIDTASTQIAALNLIFEIDPSEHINDYIRCISSGTIDEGVAECMAEIIMQNAKEHKAELLEALETTESVPIKNILLEILCLLPYEQRAYDELISMFKSLNGKALYASYLGKYGNTNAIKVLTEALDWISINYLDYIEIRNAIEELGEEVTHLRSFDGDKYYESMKEL